MIKADLKGFRKLPRAKNPREATRTWIKGTVNLARNIFAKGMARGPHTGRRYRRGRIVHQASAPGNYPATDTGRLVNGTAMEVRTFEGALGTNVKYAKYLLGTKYIKPRKMYADALDEAVRKRISKLPNGVRFD